MDADIVDRLRESVRACRALDRSALLAEAADEIERLRKADEAPEVDVGSLPPEWLQRPYWVDPPSGWRYGFPRLYDPTKDGDMTQWMIAKGYPEKLARQDLDCTFTAANDD